MLWCECEGGGVFVFDQNFTFGQRFYVTDPQPDFPVAGWHPNDSPLERIAELLNKNYGNGQGDRRSELITEFIINATSAGPLPVFSSVRAVFYEVQNLQQFTQFPFEADENGTLSVGHFSDSIVNSPPIDSWVLGQQINPIPDAAALDVDVTSAAQQTFSFSPSGPPYTFTCRIVFRLAGNYIPTSPAFVDPSQRFWSRVVADRRVTFPSATLFQ